jgi:glycolate oxidase subunit GlcD
VDQLIDSLRAIVGSDAVLAKPEELLVYECDGLPQHKYLPRAVVFPESTDEVAEVMKLMTRLGVPFTPRGAGTGLSGGALALNRGVVIELARMRRILKVDAANRLAVVQTGVVNLNVSRAVAHLGLHYIPDPSSQPTCTIGGNIAENAGGIHCLKYGTTTDHVLSARVVLASGEIVTLHSGESGVPGYDLLGVFIGSEGTFGIATEATLRLTPLPPAVRTLLAEFAEVDDASQAVSAIIAGGVMPAALEMMDREIIKAIEASVFAAGLPPDAGAALLIELDGLEAGIDDEAELVKSICARHGARSCRLARDDNERKQLWAARKGAFGAIGRISPDSMIQDTVVPRSRLPEVMRDSYRIANKYGLILANVFHAGDGNLHPFICFDSRSEDQVRRVKEAGRELMETCVRAGGSITGEHGVGLDKRDYLPLIFSEADMNTMLSVRAAFDPIGMCNPGKIIPMLRGCGEARAVSPSSIETQNNGKGVRSFIPKQHTEPAVATVGRMAIAREPHKLALRLSAIVGPTHVSGSPLTVEPETFEQVVEVMKFSASERLHVVPAGSLTWLDTGNPVSRTDLILSTRRLNRIVEHEPADLIATAQAGVKLDDFNLALGSQGQWLPIDPPNDGRATIGGVVATGVGGAQTYGYGPPRRFAIGMKIVLADGQLVKAGGRVVKNVAGYDLCKLFTGSYGTLGVIVECTFKLRPLPASTGTLLAFGPPDSLISGAQKLLDERLFPVAGELLSPQFAREAEFSDGTSHLLLVRFAGSTKAVEDQVRRATKVLKKWSTDAGPVEDNEATAWAVLAQIPLQSRNRIIWRSRVALTNLSQLVASVDKTTMWQASVFEGRLRGFQDNDANVLELLKQNREWAGWLGGTLVIETAPKEIKNGIDSWGSFKSREQLMQRVKQQLDPHNLLSPGRFEC